jgi:hypothetical protein
MNRSLVHAFLEVTRREGTATSFAYTPEDMFGRPEFLVGQPKVPSADVLGLLRHARDRNLVLGRIEKSGAGRALVRVGESARGPELQAFVRDGLSALVPWLELAVFVGLRDPDPDFETAEEEQRRLLLQELGVAPGLWDADRARRVFSLSAKLGEVADGRALGSVEESVTQKLVAIEGGLKGYRAQKGASPLSELVLDAVPVGEARDALGGSVARSGAVVKAATAALVLCASLVTLLEPQIEEPGGPQGARREQLESDYRIARALADELVALLGVIGGAAEAR